MADHSAAGSALGYVFQCQWALVALLQRGQDEPLCELRVEKLDDIQFGQDSNDPTELLQTKHHATPSSDLSDQSVDLWRTLNVWMDVVDLDAPSLPSLMLVTTEIAAEGSALSRLREDDPDPNEAVIRLQQAALDSENKTTQAWRKKFCNLTEEQRFALVSAVRLTDGAPQVGGLDEELCRYLRALLPPGHESTFLDRVKGWWSRIYVELLNETRESVSADDVHAVIRQIAQDFGPESLPVLETLRNMLELEAEVDQQYRENTFVTQLLWIALEEQRLWKAIRDYHRAYTQRSEWLRLQLLGEAEIAKYASKLYQEWEMVFDRHRAAADRNGTDRVEAGMAIFEEVIAHTKARVRSKVDEAWLNRGTLHAMADVSREDLGLAGMTIGWHPDFEEKLEELLTGAGP